MTHRAETITAAVVTAVTGLTTTTTNVFRGRTSTVVAPGLLIYQEADTIDTVQSHDVLISQLDLVIMAVSSLAADLAEVQLNLIREEVTVALAADYQLGLPAIVLDSQEIGAPAPEIDQPVKTLRLQWRVTYQRSRTNPAL